MNEKICFVSLGCDKNLVDSEIMLGLIRDAGFELTDDESQADVAIVNTCCFIHDAKEESIQTLIELGQWKKKGHLKALIACGCLAQRYAKEIREDIPEVDALVGTTAFDKIVPVIRRTLEGGQAEEIADLKDLPVPEVRRVNTTGGYTSYLKIADGCNKHCTYCVIPKIRGEFRSVPMEHLLKEARELAEGGVTELILVAQETTLYGVDLYGKKMLPALLKELCQIEGLHWIRILYAYPEEVTDELIAVMAEEPKICHYIDLPIQHASDDILRRMARRTDQAELRRIVGALREAIPDIAIRTTLITGFPGERQEDFEELYRFVNEMEFDRLGVFTYSAEENTPAAKMPHQIPERIKRRRRDELMELQQEIAFEAAEEMIGRELEVLIEGKLPDEDVYLGRSYKDAPGVDGYVFVDCDHELLSGQYVKVKIYEAKDYDLMGVIVDEEDENESAE